MGRKVRGSNVMLKLDMAKAYDRLNWAFLIQVLRSFGFREHFIDMMWRLISNCYFSVLVNGQPCGYFKATRGLRQGDPLCSALFIISTEVLLCGLNGLLEQPRFSPFFVSKRVMRITHLAYADDVIVFLRGDTQSLKCHACPTRVSGMF